MDIDPFAIAAIELNARANRQRIETVRADLLAEGPPDVDLILAGDCWYEEPIAARATDWLRRCWDQGCDVLLGDPGRRYLSRHELRELATYAVRSTSDLEDLGRDRAAVLTFREAPEP